MNISSIAEEVKNYQTTVPLSMLSSIFVITVIYILMLIVTVCVPTSKKLSSSLTPIADASRIFMENLLSILSPGCGQEMKQWGCIFYGILIIL